MHSALSALDSMDTQHSVPLTLQALSAECEHRVWSHVPVSPDDLWPLSLSLSAPHPGLPRLRVDLSRNFELEVRPRALASSAGAARRVRGQKLWFKKKL